MEPVNIAQALPVLLGIAGGALQYVMRQFQRVPEWAYHLVAIALTAGCFVLVVRDWPRPDWRDSTIVAALWIAGNLATVYGGTFLASNGAKAVAAANPSAKGSLAVPLTDSK